MAYLFTFFLSIIFCKLSDFFLDRKKALGILLLVIAILIPSVLAGCRDLSIGSDTGFYVLNYFKVAKYSRSFAGYLDEIPAEIGYALFNYLITKLFLDMSWLLFFIQAFVMVFISLSILNLKKRNLLPWAFFVYFLLYFSTSLNMTRQTMAIAVCLYSFSNLLTGKVVKALIFAAVAIAFHYTAFIFLAVFPIYFYTSKFIKNFWLFQMIISVACILIVLMLDNIILIFIGAGILDQGFNTYTSGGLYGSNIPASDLFLGFVFLISFTILKGKSTLSDERKNLFQTIFLVAVILCFAAVQSTFAVRGMYYFSYLSIIIIPILVTELKNLKIQYLAWICTFCLFILFWYLTVPNANLGETYPYKSKILNL